MAGPVDPSRDLRLGLVAFESRVIDQDQLIAALAAWTRSADRPLAEILLARGLLAPAALARLEERVRDERAARETSTASAAAPDATVAFVPSRLPQVGQQVEHGTAGAGARFEILRPHARGGLGEIFLAFDRELNRTVALKELQPRRAHDAAAQQRFLREAEVTGMLEHPGIVPIYSLGRYPDGRPFYAMHLIQGETLRTAIERFHHPPTPAPAQSQGRVPDRELTLRRLLRSLIEACNAIGYAHSRGVVHRDLKPENIMLGPFGETLIVDWGLAKRLADETGDEASPAAPESVPEDLSMTLPGALLGTPRYMSPEQADGDLDRVSPASDVYSLGAIIYCVLVGHDPFPGEDVPTILDRVRRGIFPAPRRVKKTVDPLLEAICLKAMALNPAERHGSALELAAALETWLADVRYRGEHERALGEVKTSLARLSLERAHQCFDRTLHAEGMLWLARALENVPDHPPDFQRVLRTSLHAWHAGARLLERSIRHDGAVHALAFCPEGRRLATACAPRGAHLWDVSTGSPLAPRLGHEVAVHAVAFHPDGHVVATAGDDGRIHRWDAVTGAALAPPLETGAPVTALAFSPDGAWIAAAGGPRAAFVWASATGAAVAPRDVHEHPALAIAFAPDGNSLAIACDDGLVLVRETATGKPRGAPLAHESAVPCLAFDPQGRWLLTGTLEGRIRLWDVGAGAEVVSLAQSGAIRSAAFRPGGDAFATACADGTARLWESATGRPIGEPLDHRSSVDCLAFHPEATMVATGSRDGMVRLWCATTALPIGPALAHGGSVQTLAFSPDGRRLASGGADAAVRCWKTPSPVDGDVERIACWVRVSTNRDFDPGDAIHLLDGPTSWDLRRRLSELGGPPLK